MRRDITRRRWHIANDVAKSSPHSTTFISGMRRNTLGTRVSSVAS